MLKEVEGVRLYSLADNRPHEEVVKDLKQEGERTVFLPSYIYYSLGKEFSALSS